MKVTILKLFVFLFINTLVYAQTDAYQNHEVITQAVTDFLYDQPTPSHITRFDAEVSPLDPRMNLTACRTPLEIFWPKGASHSGSTTVGVRCASPNPWRIYLPVQITLRVQALVTARTIARGAVLASEDVSLAEQEISRSYSDYFTSPDQVVGLVVNRAIPSGQLVRASMLEKPIMIKKGEAVTLKAMSSGLEVRMNGVALADGAKGARIRVENKSSKRTVEGIVIEPGVVEIQF